MASPKQAAHGETVEWAGRAGLLAKGVSFALVGVLALEVAFDGGGSTPDRQGALRRIAEGGIGRAALIALAIGFAGYAIWRLAQAIFDRANEGDDPPGLAKRAVQFGKAVLYAALAATGCRSSSTPAAPPATRRTSGRLGSSIFRPDAGSWPRAGS